MALAGYNPNASLLPTGNGPIQAMSGGGMGTPPPNFNPSLSLLPSAGGDINSYSGGFLNEPIQILPNTSTSTITGGAKIPTGLKAENITQDSVEVSWTNFDPLGQYSGKATPIPKPITSFPEDAEPTPKLAIISATIDMDKKIATFKGLASNQEYYIVLYSAKSPSESLKIKTLEKSKDENKNLSKNNTLKNDDKSRPIILFGTEINLTNPKKMNTDTLTDDQIIALQKFGLDGPGLSTKEKIDIIQALYDGKCNTDQPMIFLQNCEPIRRVVQALALNLLEKLQTKDSEIQLGVKKEEQPVVEYKQTEDKGMRICITFKPEQLGLLSKFSKKNIKINNASKKDIFTPIKQVNLANSEVNLSEEVKPLEKDEPSVLNAKTNDVAPKNGNKDVNEKGDEEQNQKLSLISEETNSNIPVSEEEINKLLSELLNEMGELNLPTNQEMKVEEFKEKEFKKNELTEKELNELYDILDSLTVTNIPPEKTITIEEMKEKLDEIKNGMTKNQKIEGGYDIITTRGILNVNPSVSCYCISTMQFLYSIPEIRNAILQYDCSGLTLDETTITSISDNSIKESINTKYTEKAKVNEVVDGRMIFCAMRKLFEQLNSDNISFDKLDTTTANVLLNSTGKNNPISNVYTKYIMRIFVAYMNKEIEEKNKRELEKNPNYETESLESINQQQAATDFLTGFIFPLMENDIALSDISNIFNYRPDTVYTCEQNSPSEPRKKSPTIGNIEKIINLGISSYIDDKEIPSTNKYERGTTSYSLDKIIEYSQTIESMTGDNMLLGCGPKNTTPGAKNNGQTKGPGTKKTTYIIPSENRYLLVYTNRPRFDWNTQEKIFNLNERLFINPEIIVDNKVYHIYGSILYSAGGEEKPKMSGIFYNPVKSGGGHYIYNRFYIPDDTNPATGMSANELPFVTYNDERVLYKNKDINIDNKSYLIVYRFVKKLGTNKNSKASLVPESDSELEDNGQSDSISNFEEETNSQTSSQENTNQQPSTTTGSVSEDEMTTNNESQSEPSISSSISEESINSNLQKQINERKSKNKKNAENSLKVNANSQVRMKSEQNNAKRKERSQIGPEPTINSQGIFGNITENNFKPLTPNTIQQNNSPIINITPEIANPLKTKLGQAKKKFSNLSRTTIKNNSKAKIFQRQAAAVNVNIKRLTPGKKITQKNINNIKARLNEGYNKVQGGKRKTFKKALLTRKSKTMKKYQK